MPLEPKEALFVKEYLVDLNATQAAIRAGYSKKSATVTASRLLAKAKVKEAIDRAKNARAARVELTADSVLEGIKRLSRMAEDTGELGTALKAHELLGKHLRLFVDRLELTARVTLEQLVVESLAKPQPGPPPTPELEPGPEEIESVPGPEPEDG